MAIGVGSSAAGVAASAFGADASALAINHLQPQLNSRGSMQLPLAQKPSRGQHRHWTCFQRAWLQCSSLGRSASALGNDSFAGGNACAPKMPLHWTKRSALGNDSFAFGDQAFSTTFSANSTSFGTKVRSTDFPAWPLAWTPMWQVVQPTALGTSAATISTMPLQSELFIPMQIMP